MVWGERLVRCFYIVEAWTVSGSVSVTAITFLSTSMARALPISFGCSHLHPTSVGHLMSVPASLKTSAASWRAAVDGHAWIASLGGSGVNSNTVVWLGLETYIDFEDECLLRPAVQSLCKRLGTFVLVHTPASISLGLQSTGLCWPKQYFGASTGDLEGFWFLFIFEKVLYWGHFTFISFPYFVFIEAWPVVLGP